LFDNCQLNLSSKILKMKILKNEQTVVPMNKYFKEQIKKKYKKKRAKKTKPPKSRYLLVLAWFFVILLLVCAILLVLIQKNYFVFKWDETNEKQKKNPIITGLELLNCTFNKCSNFGDTESHNSVWIFIYFIPTVNTPELGRYRIPLNWDALFWLSDVFLFYACILETFRAI